MRRVSVLVYLSDMHLKVPTICTCRDTLRILVATDNHLVSSVNNALKFRPVLD